MKKINFKRIVLIYFLFLSSILFVYTPQSINSQNILNSSEICDNGINDDGQGTIAESEAFQFNYHAPN